MVKQKGLVYIHGKFLPLEKASLPITDLAVQRGVGLFETLRTYHKIPFALDERLRRLNKSARFLGFKPIYSSNFIRKKVFEGLREVKADEAVVKIILTGGDGLSLNLEGRSRLLILFFRLHKWSKAYYEKGIRLKTFKFSRVLPELKSLSYLAAVFAQQKARKAGFDEALLLDEKNRILEGANFNFTILKNRKLIVPAEGVLNGMTMEIAIRLAQSLGFKTIRRALKYQELKQAEEAFVTSATREVMPVAQVDKIKIGNGRPGKYTKRLLVLYRDYANRKRKD